MAKKKAKKRDPNATVSPPRAGTVVGTIVEKKVQEIHLKSWNEFKSFLVNLYGEKRFEQDRYLFRGQGRSYWELESTFDRQFPVAQYDKGKRVLLYQEMLDVFKVRLADSDIPHRESWMMKSC